LEDPLWIFVGQTVNAVSGRELTKKDKVSDVEEVVRFLNRVLSERETIINEIEDIISGSEFLDEEGKALFEDRFNYLKTAEVSPEGMYQEILDLIFNSSADAKLNVVRLKNTERNEIGLVLEEMKTISVSLILGRAQQNNSLIGSKRTPIL